MKTYIHGCTCEHTHTYMHTLCAVLGVLNENITGPFVETPATSKQREGRREKQWVSVENVSLKDGNVSFSAVSLSGIYFTMAHSTVGDALAYSDGASLEGLC